MTRNNAREQVRRLDLRVDEQDDGADDYPVVTILIDGHDQLTSARSGSIGFDPDAILGDDSPLLPTGPWRRVAVYRCECGIAECGVIAPLIVRRTDGRVVWTDFRDYTGVFDGPTLPRDPDNGRRLNQSDLVFDENQYVAEVRRASGDRSWESARRVTARLLEAELADSAGALARAGYELGWVSKMSRTSGR